MKNWQKRHRLSSLQEKSELYMKIYSISNTDLAPSPPPPRYISVSILQRVNYDKNIEFLYTRSNLTKSPH